MLSSHLRSKLVLVGCVLLVGTMTSAAFAQEVPDVSGIWDLQAVAFPGQPERGQIEDCVFSGTAEVSQTGSELSGVAAMTLDSGDATCPAEMSAMLAGSIDGTDVFVTLTDATLGTANLDGSFAVRGVPGIGGTMSVATGPFAGYGGTFTAAFRGPSASVIPTAGNVAVIAFVLMLAALGAMMARDRMQAG